MSSQHFGKKMPLDSSSIHKSTLLRNGVLQMGVPTPGFLMVSPQKKTGPMRNAETPRPAPRCQRPRSAGGHEAQPAAPGQGAGGDAARDARVERWVRLGRTFRGARRGFLNFGKRGYFQKKRRGHLSSEVSVLGFWVGPCRWRYGWVSEWMSH